MLSIGASLLRRTVVRGSFSFQSPSSSAPLCSSFSTSSWLGAENLDSLDLEGLQSELKKSTEHVQDVKQRIRTYRGEDSGRRILVLGAGRSATSLIQYFIDNSVQQNWSVYVGDSDLQLAESKTKGHPRSCAFQLDASNDQQLRSEIQQSDIVISLLPVALHHKAQTHCLEVGRNLVTASYVSPFAKQLEDQVKAKNLIFLNEVGLDPGIDHMISMKIINEIRKKNGNLTRFESFCGGLVSPECVQGNPWQYKFTWNPRNVVLAGQGGCRFLQRGAIKVIPYQNIFSRVERLQIPGFGEFEGLANRDSLEYKEVYGLHDVGTLFRGTLRRPGYCKAWNALVRLGLTDDTRVLDTEHMTFRQFTNIFLPYRPQDTIEMKVAYLLGMSLDGETFHKLKWLGLFEDELIGLKEATPAQVLQKLLEKRWAMGEDDKDMIVMLNKFEYKDADSSKYKEIQSSMVVTGKNSEETAMAMTVGLPAAICTKLILNGEIKRTGMVVPTTDDIYLPVLKELEEHGISFLNIEKEFNPLDEE